MDEKELTLSVVITSYNQLEYLSKLLPLLAEQDFPQNRYEIVVIDDGSTDGTRDWLKKQSFANLKLLLLPQNSGRSVARNQGIILAQGKIIVMIDGDHTVQKNFLSIHAERHSKEYCIIVGRSNFVTHPNFVAINNYLDKAGAYKLPSNTRLPGRYFLTRNCSVPRDLLIKIGLFDEEFKVWGGEDLDLGVRLEKTGVPIYGEAKALAIHHHLRPLDELLKNLYTYGYYGIPHLLKKHPKLFVELNLDRTLSNPYHFNRFQVPTRYIMRAFMLAPFYVSVRFLANALKTIPLPRFIFDYLHLRQYTYGYMNFLKDNQNKI